MDSSAQGQHHGTLLSSHDSRWMKQISLYTRSQLSDNHFYYVFFSYKRLEIALCTITKNRFRHMRPPHRLRQTLRPATKKYMSVKCGIEGKERKTSSNWRVSFKKDKEWLVPNTVVGVSVKPTRDIPTDGQNPSKSWTNRERKCLYRSRNQPARTLRSVSVG